MEMITINKKSFMFIKQEYERIQQERDKYKEVIDKIKEKLQEKDNNGYEKIYVEDAIFFINELLEEVNDKSKI